jgi:hypothetical protein
MEKTLTAERPVPKMLSMPAHFGPFEVDAENGRLLKHGVAVRLREQPFQVLEAWAMATEARGLGAAQPLNEGHFGYVAGVPGHRAEACAVLEGLKDRRERSYCPAVPIAWTYLGLGDTGRSLDWLETALAEREPYLGSAMVFRG